MVVTIVMCYCWYQIWPSRTRNSRAVSHDGNDERQPPHILVMTVLVYSAWRQGRTRYLIVVDWQTTTDNPPQSCKPRYHVETHLINWGKQEEEKMRVVWMSVCLETISSGIYAACPGGRWSRWEQCRRLPRILDTPFPGRVALVEIKWKVIKCGDPGLCRLLVWLFCVISFLCKCSGKVPGVWTLKGRSLGPYHIVRLCPRYNSLVICPVHFKFCTQLLWKCIHRSHKYRQLCRQRSELKSRNTKKVASRG